jgi:RNA polymerase nonessential primary-like sigma factor
MLPSHATAPDDEASAHQLSAALLERIETLPPKLQHVIRGRFYEDQTLQEIGLELGVSRERVRQLECEALHLLRQKTEDLRGAI